MEQIFIPRRAKVSIHAPRAGSDYYNLVCYCKSTLVSIHAPRAGSDVVYAVPPHSQEAVSIHAPRAGSDCQIRRHPKRAESFNPRSPCGERPYREDTETYPVQFQSTLPVRGATGQHQGNPRRDGVSIHAPRAGSDSENSDHYPDFQIILVWLFVFWPRPAPCFKHTSNSTAFKAVFWCEPPCKSMCSSASHQRIILSSGKYAFLQPKCSILF